MLLVQHPGTPDINAAGIFYRQYRIIRNSFQVWKRWMTIRYAVAHVINCSLLHNVVQVVAQPPSPASRAASMGQKVPVNV